MKTGMKNAIPAVVNSDLANKMAQAALSEVKQAVNEEIQKDLQIVEKEAVNFINSLGVGEGNNNESPEQNVGSPEKGTEREETDKKAGFHAENEQENNEMLNAEPLEQEQGNQMGLQEEKPEEKVFDLEEEERERERKLLEEERERELEEERLREEEEDRERQRQEELERENQDNYYNDNYNYDDYNDYEQENENQSEEKPVEQNIQIKNADDFFQVNQENDVMKMINGDDDEETGIKQADFYDHHANENDLNPESEEQDKKDVIFLKNFLSFYVFSIQKVEEDFDFDKYIVEEDQNSNGDNYNGMDSKGNERDKENSSPTLAKSRQGASFFHFCYFFCKFLLIFILVEEMKANPNLKNKLKWWVAKK